MSTSGPKPEIVYDSGPAAPPKPVGPAQPTYSTPQKFAQAQMDRDALRNNHLDMEDPYATIAEVVRSAVEYTPNEVTFAKSDIENMFSAENIDKIIQYLKEDIQAQLEIGKNEATVMGRTDIDNIKWTVNNELWNNGETTDGKIQAKSNKDRSPKEELRTQLQRVQEQLLKQIEKNGTVKVSDILYQLETHLFKDDVGQYEFDYLKNSVYELQGFDEPTDAKFLADLPLEDKNILLSDNALEGIAQDIAIDGVISKLGVVLDRNPSVELPSVELPSPEELKKQFEITTDDMFKDFIDGLTRDYLADLDGTEVETNLRTVFDNALLETAKIFTLEDVNNYVKSNSIFSFSESPAEKAFREKFVSEFLREIHKTDINTLGFNAKAIEIIMSSSQSNQANSILQNEHVKNGLINNNPSTEILKDAGLYTVSVLDPDILSIGPPGSATWVTYDSITGEQTIMTAADIINQRRDIISSYKNRGQLNTTIEKSVKFPTPNDNSPFYKIDTFIQKYTEATWNEYVGSEGANISDQLLDSQSGQNIIQELEKKGYTKDGAKNQINDAIGKTLEMTYNSPTMAETFRQALEKMREDNPTRVIDLNDSDTLNEFENKISEIILPEIKENLKTNLKNIEKPPHGSDYELNEDELNEFVNENAHIILDMAKEFIRV
jgi:hypothetical protein